jgi:hypothetical protein
MQNVNLEQAAREMWELYEMDAERICLQSAKRAEEEGAPDFTRGWREIAHACRRYIGPSPAAPRKMRSSA